jgi:hypothetical protein
MCNKNKEIGNDKVCGTYCKKHGPKAQKRIILDCLRRDRKKDQQHQN